MGYSWHDIEDFWNISGPILAFPEWKLMAVLFFLENNEKKNCFVTMSDNFYIQTGDVERNTADGNGQKAVS